MRSAIPSLARVPLLTMSSVLVACSSTAAPGATQPVRLSVAASRSPGRPSVVGPIQLSSFQIVLGDVGLGSGDQFGCINCQNNDTGEQQGLRQVVLDVPLDGTPVLVATERAAPGTYAKVEISLVRPIGATVSRVANWPANASMLVAGTYGGTAFSLAIDAEGSFREALQPALTIGDGTTAQPVSLTITLPVASWFEVNGTALDPNDPAQAAQIQVNARASLVQEPGHGEVERR